MVIRLNLVLRGILLSLLSVGVFCGCQVTGGGGNDNQGDEGDDMMNDNAVMNDNAPDNENQGGNVNDNASPNDNGAGGSNSNTVEACTELTYENFAVEFFAANCLFCHSSDKSGIDRNGAPSDINFDSLEGVQANLDRIRERATVLQTMPPSFAPVFPTDDARAMLQEWIDCDAPE